jgi:hypothetical protein
VHGATRFGGRLDDTQSDRQGSNRRANAQVLVREVFRVLIAGRRQAFREAGSAILLGHTICSRVRGLGGRAGERIAIPFANMG